MRRTRNSLVYSGYWLVVHLVSSSQSRSFEREKSCLTTFHPSPGPFLLFPVGTLVGCWMLIIHWLFSLLHRKCYAVAKNEFKSIWLLQNKKPVEIIVIFINFVFGNGSSLFIKEPEHSDLKQTIRVIVIYFNIKMRKIAISCNIELLIGFLQWLRHHTS